MKSLRLFLVLSSIGTLFALSVTLRQFIAPATTPGIFSCVGFKVLGYSPCPFGLAFFAVMAVLAALIYFKQITLAKALVPLRLVTAGGVLFSGWVAWREVGLPLVLRGTSYFETFNVWSVPACAWGFVVFLIAGFVIMQTQERVKSN